MDPFILFDHVSYRYQQGEGPAIQALEDISLSIAEGEFVAVIGANGSGKSTFARLVNGLLLPQAGSVWIAGADTRRSDLRAQIYAAVGMVFQFPEDQIVSTTVEEDVAFGPENMALPREEVRRRVDYALNEVGLSDLRTRPPHLLSAGQIQRVALAGVLAMQPRCMIFDEASTMLDPAGRRVLIEAMHRLHLAGTTILTVTHFMDEAVLAGRVIVLDQGRVVMDGPPEQVFSDQERLTALRLDLPPAGRVSAALRRVIPHLPQNLLTLPLLLEALPAFPGSSGGAQEAVPLHSPRGVQEPPLIEVSGLGYSYMAGTPLAQRALKDVSLTICAGQTHGLLGMTGSGKTTLMQHLNALLRPQEGRLRVAEFDLSDPKVARRDVVRKVGLVFQNPETQFFEYFVGDEIAYGPRQFKVDEPLAERVRWAMEQVGLDFATYKDRPLNALSGGERRKVAVASTLALKPSILLLDEPTAGLDPYSRRELLNRLAAMRDSGITLVLSSHRMEDLGRLADSLTVFNRGQVVLDGSTGEVFSMTERLNQFGLEPPVSTTVAAAMRARGWPLPHGILTSDMLRQAAARALDGTKS
jgi:energy-coupling factor transport system ATP-binding protein